MSKKEIVKVSSTSADVWETIREIIINKSDVSLIEVSKATGIPVKAIEAQAIQAGWLTKRDLNVIVKTQNELNRVMLEISYQINESDRHAEAFIEALQYSHRIKLVRDAQGSLHYRNFEEYPDRPDNWLTLDETQREALRRYIPPSRLSKFWQDILTVQNFKKSLVDYVSKMSKASLPKMDVTAVTLSNKITEAIDDKTEIDNLLKDDGTGSGSGDDLQVMINNLNKDIEEKEDE
jgi:hypothetical protein